MGKRDVACLSQGSDWACPRISGSPRDTLGPALSLGFQFVFGMASGKEQCGDMRYVCSVYELLHGPAIY